MSRTSVIIVGGGLAGLSVAWDLSLEPSLDVMLIEKRQHLGGRVFTLNVHGQEIDVGGFLIYPWYKRYHQLIQALGLSSELTHIRNTLQGDVHATHYFRRGSKVFVDRLQQSLAARHVEFSFGCEFREMRDQHLVTNQGELSADHVVFCQPPRSVAYTRFVTAMVAFSGEASIGQDEDWGACFYRPTEYCSKAFCPS